MISDLSFLGALKRVRTEEDTTEETKKRCIEDVNKSTKQEFTVIKKNRFYPGLSLLERMPDCVLGLIFNRYIKSNLVACFLVSHRIRDIVIVNPLFGYLKNEGMILSEIKSILFKTSLKEIKQRVNLLVIQFCFRNRMIEDFNEIENFHTKRFNNLKHSVLCTAVKKSDPKKNLLSCLPFNFSMEKPLDLSTLQNVCLRFRIKQNPDLTYLEIKDHFLDQKMINLLINLDISYLKKLFNNNWNRVFELLEIKNESASYGYRALTSKILRLLFSVIKEGEVDKQLKIEYLKKIITTEYFQTIPFSNVSSESSDFFYKIVYFLLEQDKEISLQLAKILCDGAYSHTKVLAAVIIFTYHRAFTELKSRFQAWHAEELDPLDPIREHVFGASDDLYYLARHMNEKPEITLNDFRMEKFQEIMLFYDEIDRFGEDLNGNEVFGLSVFLNCLMPLVPQKVLLNWFDISVHSLKEEFAQERIERNKLKAVFIQAFLECGKNPLFKEHDLLLHLLLNRFPQYETYEEGSIKNRHVYLNLIGNLDVEAMLRAIFGNDLVNYRKENFQSLTDEDGIAFLRLFMELLDNPVSLTEKNEKLITDVLKNFLNDVRLLDSLTLLYRGKDKDLDEDLEKPLFQLLAEKKLVDCARILLSRMEKILLFNFRNNREFELKTLENLQDKSLKNSDSIPLELDLLFEQLDWINVFRKIKKTEIIPNL